MTVRYELAFNEGSGTNIAEANGGGAATLQAGGSWVAGHTGNAVVSATATTAAAVANTSALSTASWTGITVMAWLKFNTAGSADDLIAGFDSASHTTNPFGIGLTSTTSITGWVTTNTTADGYTAYTHGWTNGAWHHVAVTWSSVSGTVTFWSDGTSRWTVALAGATLVSNMGIVELGNVYWNGSGTSTKASVDDFRVYDNELTGGQITTAMNTPVGPATVAYPFGITTPTPRYR